jgi:hypothetical protein
MRTFSNANLNLDDGFHQGVLEAVGNAANATILILSDRMARVDSLVSKLHNAFPATQHVTIHVQSDLVAARAGIMADERLENEMTMVMEWMLLGASDVGLFSPHSTFGMAARLVRKDVDDGDGSGSNRDVLVTNSGLKRIGTTEPEYWIKVDEVQACPNGRVATAGDGERLIID